MHRLNSYQNHPAAQTSATAMMGYMKKSLGQASAVSAVGECRCADPDSIPPVAACERAAIQISRQKEHFPV